MQVHVSVAEMQVKKMTYTLSQRMDLDVVTYTVIHRLEFILQKTRSTVDRITECRKAPWREEIAKKNAKKK